MLRLTGKPSDLLTIANMSWLLSAHQQVRIFAILARRV
jgi:hypothetical protein